jgi:hypothetical protein
MKIEFIWSMCIWWYCIKATGTTVPAGKMLIVDLSQYLCGTPHSYHHGYTDQNSKSNQERKDLAKHHWLAEGYDNVFPCCKYLRWTAGTTRLSNHFITGKYR